MTLPRDTRSAILDRCRSAGPQDLSGCNVYSGWPGLVLLARCIRRATGETVRELDELALRWRGLDVPRASLPAELYDTFLYGARGRRWAELSLAGDERSDDGAPPARPLGFDTFANDGPVFFEHAAAHRPAWSRFVAAELAHLEHALDEGRAVPLGFAHGVAGLLFRALRLDDAQVIDATSLRRHLDWLAAQRVELDGGARWPARLGQEVADTWVAASLCNGSLGHAVLFLEAAVRMRDERYVDIAHQALTATADEERFGLGFCCGHAGRAMVVSRFLRLGLRLGDAEGSCLERLWARLPAAVHEGALRPLSGLTSCLPALHAEDPASAVLDFFLPPPTPFRA